MPAFTAGQKLGASDLNALIAMAYVTADVSKTSSTALGNITGLSFALAANSEYAMAGHISYYALDAADLKTAFTGPTGMTVSWSLLGPPSTATTIDATTNFQSLETYTDSNVLVIGSETDAASACRPAGFWRTGATSGTLQMRFAQNTSSATALVIKRGSWLSLVKLS